MSARRRARAKTRTKRRGRPPLDPNDPSESISFSLPGRQLKELEERARRARVPTPEIIRRELAAVAAARKRRKLAPASVPTNGNGNGHRREAIAELPPLTAQQRRDGWHDSQLGRTRRVDLPVDLDDEDGKALIDGDPWK